MSATVHSKEVDGAVGTDKPMFSEPWKGSDLVLVVEDQRLHVHRLILGMTSPVFEAMFSREFKEKDAAEVEFPGKKADEIRDLFGQIYPNPGDITMDNVEHLLKLADEYQIKAVVERCKKAPLSLQPNSPKAHAIKALLLAQRYDMDEVRPQCYKLLHGMTLNQLKALSGFENLDRDSVREILEGRLKDLEKFLKDLYPQLAGIVDCATYLWMESGRQIDACPVHYKNFSPVSTFQHRLECPACKAMLTKMTIHNFYPGKKSYPNYAYDKSFDKKIVVVLQDMLKLLRV